LVVRYLEASTMETGEPTLFVKGAVAGFGGCCLMLVLWHKVIAPAIPRYASCSASDRCYLSNAVVNMFPSLVVPALLIAAGLPSGKPWADCTLAPSPLALVALGMTCGYLTYDTLFCLYYEEHRTALNFVHHLLSIVIWPWSMLGHRAVPFCEFFAFTEITSILQNSRMIMARLGHDSSPLYAAVGLSWTLSFFVVRILPGPYLLYLAAYIVMHNTWQPISLFMRWLGILTIPLPFLLNFYWFCLMIKGLVGFLKKYNSKKEQKLAAGLLSDDGSAGATT